MADYGYFDAGGGEAGRRARLASMQGQGQSQQGQAPNWLTSADRWTNRTFFGTDQTTPQMLFGSQQDPGVLGTGYHQPGQAGVDPNAANIPNFQQDRDRSLAAALAAQGRGGPSADYARIAMGPQAQFRQGQMSLAQILAGQAMGQGPSLAQAQLQSATDRNLSQAMALGQSNANGQMSGLTQRNIMQQQQGTAQQAAQDSGALRLQEQMQAQNQLGQLLAGARGQDIGLASEQAGLQNQTGLANLQALLSQRGMNDQMSQFYERQGTGMDLAQGAQNLSLADLLARTQMGNNQLSQQAYDNAANRRAGLVPSMLNSAGSGAGAAGQGLAALLAM
jgi:hypothetical protein